MESICYVLLLSGILSISSANHVSISLTDKYMIIPKDFRGVTYFKTGNVCSDHYWCRYNPTCSPDKNCMREIITKDDKIKMTIRDDFEYTRFTKICKNTTNNSVMDYGLFILDNGDKMMARITYRDVVQTKTEYKDRIIYKDKPRMKAKVFTVCSKYNDHLWRNIGLISIGVGLIVGSVVLTLVVIYNWRHTKSNRPPEYKEFE